jgi:outer membrane protein
MRDRRAADAAGYAGAERRRPPRLTLACAVLALAATGWAQQEPGAGLGLVDAVRLTLARQPQIRLQEAQLRFAAGALEAARGVFDLRLASTLSAQREQVPLPSAERAPGRTELSTDSVSWDVAASKLFSSGLTVVPSVSLVGQDSDAPNSVDNHARLSFSILQPLWRGRGASVVTAATTAAAFERDAAALDLRHVVARSVLDTVNAYWTYRERARRVEIARESEERFVRLEGDAQKLLAAREVAAVDIKQVSAIVALRRLTRLAAEHNLFEARQQLGLAAGLEARELLALGPPTDDFPAGDSAHAVPAALGPLIETALAQRADLTAARLRRRAAEVQVTVARDATRPQLDLAGSLGWAGRGERNGLGGWFEPLGHDLAGPSASGGLVFSWAPARRTALGQLAQNRALEEQAGTSAGDLERTIPAEVALALDSLARSAQRSEVAREACALYVFTVTAERQRLRLGISNVLDLINTEDRLTEAQSEQVSAQRDYAQAIARLRYETGTLLAGSGKEQEVDLGVLTTPPDAAGRGAGPSGPAPTP